MALPALPKKKPEPENTKLSQAETNGFNAHEREKDRKRELIKDPEVKEKTLDYIFGRSDENPLDPDYKAEDTEADEADDIK